MIHNFFYSSGDRVSFDDQDVNSRVNNRFITDYVRLPDGRSKTIGILNGITFYEDEDYDNDEVDWFQVSEVDEAFKHTVSILDLYPGNLE